jgi:hypothetical protein
MPTAQNIVPNIAAAVSNGIIELTNQINPAKEAVCSFFARRTDVANATKEQDREKSAQEVERDRLGDRMGWGIALGTAMDTPHVHPAQADDRTTSKGPSRENTATTDSGKDAADSATPTNGGATVAAADQESACAKELGTSNTTAELAAATTAKIVEALIEKDVEKLEDVVAAAESAADKHDRKGHEDLGPYEMPGAAGVDDMDPISPALAEKIVEEHEEAEGKKGGDK